MLPYSVDNALNALLTSLKETEEFRALSKARMDADANDTVKALNKEYRHLEIRARAAELSGERDMDTLERLNKVAELLHDDPDGSALLVAEYRMNALMAELYRCLADAAGTDLTIFED